MATTDKVTSQISVLARVAGFLVVAISLGVYRVTMFPDLPFGDSGELAGAVHTLGICHSSGYPTFTLVGCLFSHLPIPGEPIFKLNLLAALWVAGSVWVFYKICLIAVVHLRPGFEDGKVAANWHVLISAAGALSYAFARTVWDQAVGIEVYSFQLLLANSVIFFSVRGALVAEKSRSSFLLAALFLGLCFTNHLTTLFMVPALVFLFFRSEGFTRASLFNFAKMILVTLAPLVMYFYLPLRSSSSFPFDGLSTPFFNGGMVGSGWRYFFAHVLGSGFHDLMFSGGFAKQLNTFGILVPQQFTYLGIVPLMFGGYWLIRRRSVLFWFFGIFCLFSLGFALNYKIADIDAYFLPCFTVLLLVMVAGFASVQPRAKWISLACFAIPAALLITNFASEDNSKDFTVSESVHNWANNIEPNGVVFTSNWGYFESGLLYLQSVKGFRRDIAIVIPSNFDSFPFYPIELMRQIPQVTAGSEAPLLQLREDLKTAPIARPETVRHVVDSLIDANVPRRPIYFGFDAAPMVMGRRAMVPVGFAGKVYDPGDSIPILPTRFDINNLLSVDFGRGDKHKLILAGFVRSALENDINYERLTGQPDEAEKHGELLQSLIGKMETPESANRS